MENPDNQRFTPKRLKQRFRRCLSTIETILREIDLAEQRDLRERGRGPNNEK